MNPSSVTRGQATKGSLGKLDIAFWLKYPVKCSMVQVQILQMFRCNRFAHRDRCFLKWDIYLYNQMIYVGKTKAKINVKGVVVMKKNHL